MFTDTHLEDVVLLGSLGRPVSVAELQAVVLETGQHHDDDAALLPDHLPEVGHRAGERGLAHDVGGVAGVVVNLNKREKKLQNLPGSKWDWLRQLTTVEALM